MLTKISSRCRREVIALVSPCLVVALLMMSPTNTSGALLVYEGFDYGGSLSDGDSIVGANGGTGFSGAWAAVAPDEARPVI